MLRMTSEPGQDATAPEPSHPPVFISYASEDRAVTEKVWRLLERDGIDCWVAPRDVRHGRHYGEQIIGAIASAPALILILSGHANASTFVPKEVERAAAKRKPVFVFRIEDVLPSPELELFVSQGQWIDAWAPPLKKHVQELASEIRCLPSAAPVRDMTTTRRSRTLPRRRLVGLGLAGIALAAVLTAGFVGGWLPPKSTSASNPDSGQPKFTTTGSMSAMRSSHTATLLSDGRVLIAGGSNGSAQTATAEIYDPSDGKFSPTKSMIQARDSHTATRLADGRVLIAGGWDGAHAVGAAELYDPKTGEFISTGPLAVGRYNHTATLLLDGRVLISSDE